MKRIATAILVLVLLVAVAVPAFAMREKMYVKKDCKAYQEPDKHSRVTMELHVGHDLTVTDYIDGFYECRYGWVQAKYLSDTCPHKWGSWHTVKEPTCTQGQVEGDEGSYLYQAGHPQAHLPKMWRGGDGALLCRA